MFTKVKDFFRPPEYESIEQTQKARFLHTTLIVTTVTSLILGFQNMAEKTNLDIFLFLIAGISFLFIPANKQGHFIPIALIIAGLVFVVMTFSLLDGLGLKDAGLVTYPIFIIFTSFLLSKKAALITTFMSIGSVVFVYFQEVEGNLKPVEYSREIQLRVICVLIIAAGLFLWTLMDNWERILKNLTETYDLTLIGWGKALEYRDHETDGHSHSVVEMTIALASRLGIRGRSLDHIRRGALLHDIGKMAIPDAILLKNSSLSDSEWKIVKMHPIHAKNLLEDIPFLKPAIDIPYSHHERWDGSGYPEGLSKENIPLAARIFAVADVWDALISDRPYHRAWPKEKARDYMREQSGKLFDPRVVNAFIEYIDSKNPIVISGYRADFTHEHP